MEKELIHECYVSNETTTEALLNTIEACRHHAKDGLVYLTVERVIPEPKCPACIEADQIERNDPLAIDKEVGYTPHLRKYHCVCKKEDS